MKIERITPDENKGFNVIYERIFNSFMANVDLCKNDIPAVRQDWIVFVDNTIRDNFAHHSQIVKDIIADFDINVTV